MVSRIPTRFLSFVRPNTLIAAGIAIVVVFSGYWLVTTRASGYFSAVESDSGPISGNAKVISDASASGGKALQFNAPAAPAPSPPPPPPPGCTPASRPFPFPTSMKPDASNTGLLMLASCLTVVNGDQTYSTSFNGQTIANKDFRGFVTVTGANITFTNCLFEGRSNSTNHGLIDTEDSTGTITIQDSEFIPAFPSATFDGLWTRNAKIYRINVHGTTDGMKADSNTLVQDSYIHDMKWWANDPNQGGGETHNDGAQTFDGESNVTLRHNNIDMTGTKDASGAMAANAAWQSSATNSLATENWLDGGGCILNFAGHATPIANAVTNNRFGRHSFYQCPILLNLQANLTQNSGNVWDDTGTPIPPPQQHN